MAKQLLDRTDVVAGLEEMCRETMSQGVRADRLGNANLPCGIVNGALEYRLVEMKSLRRTEARVAAACAPKLQRRGADP